MKFLKIEKKDAVAKVEINRPEALNALNEELLSEIEENTKDLEKDSNIRVMILTGAGKAFVAGADIAKMKDFDSNGGHKFSDFGQRVFNSIQNSDLVSIAAINGFALGGGLELALSCDIRIASTNAKLGLPEVSLGLIPGFGGTQRLSRLVGLGKANELILTGDMITAEEALHFGLVNKLVSPEELLNSANSMAASILKKGTNAVKIAKRVTREGLDKTLPNGLELERIKFGELFETKETKEGLSAFLEKRKPNF
ncbi:MAG: enoyl-CoA hydratase-related protein [Leptospiraceae bacterium]|nr:enoyl-CoA hydratase/isomerase family protein [Leptospiraceae bacterium]MCK6381599.1 enoyl-CoA hydratase-related protein [Leptospiraceae bacterium]NUM41475.1 enoyl-CoA hydratase/isomerase family protein [Leptospiraceae bacterium]